VSLMTASSDGETVMHVDHATAALGQPFRMAFIEAAADAAFQGDFASGAGHLDVAGIQLRIIGQTQAHLFQNPFVRPLVALGTTAPEVLRTSLGACAQVVVAAVVRDEVSPVDGGVLVILNLETIIRIGAHPGQIIALVKRYLGPLHGFALSTALLRTVQLARPVGGTRVPGVMLRHDELLVGLVERRWIAIPGG